MIYNKTCKICGKEFESEARNTCYCSDKCAKRGAKKEYRSRKMKRINSIRNGDDKAIENIISQAYHLSREVAKLTLQKKCSCTDKDHVCEGSLHVHHKNHCVLDNHPSNLQWLCEKAHHEIHAIEEDCSINDEIKAFVVIRKQSEIRDRNAKKRLEKEVKE